MNIHHHRNSTKAFWACTALGGVAVATSMALALGSSDVGRASINDFITSVEMNDPLSACHHATRTAESYQQSGDATLGDGWQVIASTVCPQRYANIATTSGLPNASQ